MNRGQCKDLSCDAFCQKIHTVTIYWAVDSSFIKQRECHYYVYRLCIY